MNEKKYDVQVWLDSGRKLEGWVERRSVKSIAKHFRKRKVHVWDGETVCTLIDMAKVTHVQWSERKEEEK